MKSLPARSLMIVLLAFLALPALLAAPSLAAADDPATALTPVLIAVQDTSPPQQQGQPPDQGEAKAPPPQTTRLERAYRAHRAMRRGLDFLCRTQSDDGAWGSHDPVVVDSAQLGFGILNPGSHDGVRAACTAIGARAFLFYPHRTNADEAALQKAILYLLQNWKLAYDPGNAFNVWGYGYNLDFLTELYTHPEGKPWRDEIAATIPKVVAGLRKMQVAEGGWAYYTSVMMEGDSISFTTATILLGLLRAHDLGFEVPEGMIEDAGKIIKVQILPDKNFMYGTYLKYSGNHHLEDLSAGGRTQVCGLAVHLFDGSFTRNDLIDRSADYFKNVDYVAVIGNKRIIPHRDAPQNISGYFLYYGCYYAAEVMTFLGASAEPRHWEKLAAMILTRQEEEGSWWDTICFDYGDKWGTGFAVLCLERYLQSLKVLETTLDELRAKVRRPV